MPLPETSCVPVNLESPAETSASEGASLSEHQNAEPIDPATLRLCGSITYDRENGYDLEWESIDEFHQWRENEQQAHGIELRLAQTVLSHGSAVYTVSRLYVCACQGTGGDTGYQRKTDRKSRKEHKRLDAGCPCQVKIKIYPHTSTILGRYAPDHSHPTGKDNLKHIRIWVPAREHIMVLIRLGLMDKEIKKHIRAQYSEHERDHYITLGQICRMRTIVERERVQLDPNDAHLTRIWAGNVQSDGHFVYYKDKQDPPPEGSDLAHNLFILCIQTKLQSQWFRLFGNGFLGIDAMHNVTQYKGVLLFTIMAWDCWGHGVPIAWMLSSNGTQATITYFLDIIKCQSLEVLPSIFMTDRDQAQDLWALIQKWVQTTDSYKFDAWWEDIQNDKSVPQSLAEYLAREWVSVKEMWSAVFCQDRTIFEEGDTNMLLEAYHHVLKSKWLDRKRNRRIDNLIDTLLTDLLPHIHDHLKSQDIGLDGFDLAKECKEEILARAPEIPRDRIEVINQERILDFPHIRFCKHLAAVQHYFGGAKDSALTARPLPTAPDLHHASTQESNNASSQENAASLVSAVNEIITLSWQLLAQAPRDARPELVKSVHAIRTHLSVVASSTGDDQQLPEKEVIAPNQLSWPETAQRMGVRCEKRHGKVDSVLTAELIGETNRKRNCANQDPYGASEQSGKRAKPDARSTAANTRARADTEPTPARPAASAPPSSLPTPPMHALTHAPTHALTHAPTHALTHAPLYTPATPLSLSQSASSFSYYPYMQYSYPVPYTPMYYPPPTQ
ncbi:hypothetical protein EDB89DRAFT_2068386 [Lactarius sanguifluus]|nr:hypothetical protein EDB89DRAFT_2068386 [Lactarius sanguifluus]